MLCFKTKARVTHNLGIPKAIGSWDVNIGISIGTSSIPPNAHISSYTTYGMWEGVRRVSTTILHCLTISDRLVCVGVWRQNLSSNGENETSFRVPLFDWLSNAGLRILWEHTCTQTHIQSRQTTSTHSHAHRLSLHVLFSSSALFQLGRSTNSAITKQPSKPLGVIERSSTAGLRIRESKQSNETKDKK